MLVIKLLGMGKQVNMVEKLIEEHIKNSTTPIQLEVVNNYENILKYDVSGIPSLIIEDEIISQGRIPSKEEIENSLKKYELPKEYNQPKNKRIQVLVPIDHIDVSNDVLLFVKQLEEKSNIQITVLHVGSGFLDTNEPIMTHTVESLRESRIQSLKNKILQVFDSGDFPNIIYEVGFPVQVINTYSKDYDFVIMGSSGKHGLVDHLLGSVSSGVAQNANCPVLLIPNHYSGNTAFKNVLVACEDDLFQEENIDEILQSYIHDKYQEIHLVEIVQNGDEPRKPNIDKILEKYKTKYPEIQFYIHQLYNPSIVDGLNNYAEQNDINLIVMTPYRKNAIASLFHKSQTKKMVLNIKKPILIFHKDNK